MSNEQPSPRQTTSAPQTASTPLTDDLLVGLEERPPAARLGLFGFQHVMVAFAALIGVPLAFAAAVDLTPGETTVVVAGVLIAGGIITIIQAIGLGPVGARLPLFNAATFKFLGPMIVAYQVGGFPVLIGATILGGFAEMMLALFAKYLRRLFTPFLIGAFLVVIGLSLMPIGVRNLLSIGQPYAGSIGANTVAAVTLLLIVILASTTHGITRPFAVLAGFIVGYLISAAFGLVDWSTVVDARWIGLFRPFFFGAPTWPGLSVLVAITVIYLASFIETMGDTAAVSTIVREQPTTRRLRGALLADGLSGPVAAVFNAFPMTTYGQNIGLVKLTGIGSRFVVAVAGAIMILMGIIPKFAALISIMPAPVLGAGLVMTFGMIAGEGIRRLGPSLARPRNAVVVALGIAPAVGIWIVPGEMMDTLPDQLAPFVSDPMVAGLLVTMIAYWALPNRDKNDTHED